MPSISAGQSVQMPLLANEAIWVKTTGQGAVEFSCGSYQQIPLTSEYQRVGYLGNDTCIELRCASGQIDYQNTPPMIYPLTPTSSPVDVAQTVNQVNRRIDKTSLKNAPLVNKFLSTADVAVISGGAAVSYEMAPNGAMACKVTFSASSVVEFPAMTGMFFGGEAAVYMMGNKSTFVDSVTMRVYQNLGSNQQFFRQFVYATDPFNNYKDQGGAYTLYNNPLGWGSSGTPSATFSVTNFRMTLAPTSGQTGVVWLFGASLAFKKRKSRICIVVDDGYDSLITLGQPAFSRFGIPTTLAVVPSAVDLNLNGYAKLDQLKTYVAQGNAIVAHDTGNITEDFATASDAMSEVYYSIAWIEQNGLATNYYDQCYIWPEARFQNVTGQTVYLEEIKKLGVNIGRGANPIAANAQMNVDALTSFNRLTNPIIGHNWAGTTAAEATNIADIVTRINQLSDQGGVDFFLMFHKFVVDSTPDGSMSLSIRMSDLQTLINAINTKVTAGLLDAVTMPQLAANVDGFINKL